MSDVISLQNLIGSVSGLKQTMEATRLYVLLHSNGNNCNLSEYHSRFSQLMNKYSGFAANFRVEMDEFQQLLSRNITKQQLEQEREKEKLLEKLEIMSNSNDNLEIDHNLTEIEYSPATSVTNEPKQEYVDNTSCSEPEPVPVPAPIKSKQVINDIKKTKKTKKKNIRKIATPNKKQSVAKNEKKEELKQNDDDNQHQYVPYKYNGKDWHFNGVERSSTMIFIGALPNHIKIAAIQFFVMKKAKVTMRQIEETQLKQGGRGKYALVRFRSDVTMDRIVKFMDDINAENSKIAEDKRSDGMTQNKKKNNKTSWKTRVYLKFNHTFKYYESEESMFNDPSVRHEVFIRNFDILDSKCHQELSEKLLEYGELSRDIEIWVDSFGDPCCVAAFKYIEESVWCCNDVISFKGRTLDMRYSKF